jgi:hypothetical protein
MPSRHDNIVVRGLKISFEGSLEAMYLTAVLTLLANFSIVIWN